MSVLVIVFEQYFRFSSKRVLESDFRVQLKEEIAILSIHSLNRVVGSDYSALRERVEKGRVNEGYGEIYPSPSAMATRIFC